MAKARIVSSTATKVAWLSRAKARFCKGGSPLSAIQILRDNLLAATTYLKLLKGRVGQVLSLFCFCHFTPNRIRGIMP